MNIIRKYFPNLTETQEKQLEQLLPLYEEWNQKINVISRKDMDNFYERHVLHSLAITKVMRFQPNSKILDVGTGGGFPGIPLAIMFPESDFHLVDSIGKKIKVVKAVAEALQLKNVKASHERAENIKDKYDFIVSRAVTKMPEFIAWVRNKISKEQKNGLPNGILYLKGGNLREELKSIKNYKEEFPICNYFTEPFFETKKVVYIQLY
ncbi:MAG: 16S rRNA (guanine(527)-N(7))-methyltransferase RsmG [Brumimicrobium sp.]